MIVQIWEEYEGDFLQLVWVSWVSDGLCSEWNAWGFPVWMWEPQLMVTSLLNFVDLQNFKAKMEVGLWLPPVFWQARTLLKVTIILLFLSFLERPFNPHSENKEQSFQLNTFSTVRNSPHACGFVSYFVGHKWENNCRPVAGTRWTAFLYQLLLYRSRDIMKIYLKKMRWRLPGWNKFYPEKKEIVFNWQITDKFLKCRNIFRLFLYYFSSAYRVERI